jgi:alpha-D-xyloside xylohydrolase
VVAPASAGAPGIEVAVSTDPFRVSLIEDGRTIVSDAAEPLGLRYQLAGTGAQFALTQVIGREGNAYRVASTEPGRTARIVVTKLRHSVRLSVEIQPGGGVQQVYDTFAAGESDHFLGGGERGGYVDLRGQVVPVYVSNTCSYAPVPFFASTAGWGLRLVGQDVSGFAFPGSGGGAGCGLERQPSCSFPPLADAVSACMKGPLLVEDLYVGNLVGILAAFRAETGKPLVPPPDELATIKWRGRTEFGGPSAVLDDIRRFREAGIPLGWVLLDDVWQTCMGTLQFDGGRFPDPAALVRDVHALGVKFMLWISPKSVCGTYPPSELLGTPGDSVVDLRNPAALAGFEQQIRSLVALGIDGVKADRGDELALEATSESLQNEYPLLYAQAVMALLPKGSGAIFRAATVGSQRLVPGIWAGDQTGDFSGLQQAIRSGQTAAMSGFPTWGSDVGGYNSPHLTEDVFVRWAQFGAVSPIFEVGGAGPNSTPWTWGVDAMQALRDAAVLHYELFPYLYGLLREGQPVLRPLGYGFPDDPQAWASDLEVLVGPDLLAAPLTQEGTIAQVYLPPGEWIDLYSGRRVRGGSSFRRATPMDEFPLYLRAGTVVPFDLRTRRSWWGVDELEHPGRAGYMAANGTVLDLRSQPRDVQIFVPASRRPRRVTLGGRSLAWSWADGPLPGVVVRLHGPRVSGRIRLLS